MSEDEQKERDGEQEKAQCDRRTIKGTDVNAELVLKTIFSSMTEMIEISALFLLALLQTVLLF